MAARKRKWKYLERDPKSSYEQLCVKGTRVRARTIYIGSISKELPRTVEQLADDFYVSVEAVKEAIAYCESDPPEFKRDWEREERRIREENSFPTPLSASKTIRSKAV
jgi:uncharacterized protein (DUF433 family)